VRWTVLLCALGYPLTLLTVALGFRFIGERWWVTTAALYLPRAGFALPLPFLTLALLVTGQRRWLLTQAIAAALVLFPLMGLWISLPHSAQEGLPHLRVLSLNAGSDLFGPQAISSQVGNANADLILLQEARPPDAEALKTLLPNYHFSSRGQFLAASRYPLEDEVDPPRITHHGVLRTPHFVSYTWVTPGGRVRVYNVHTVSPRESLENLRGQGIREELLTGRIFTDSRVRAGVMLNAELRVAQIQAVSEDAKRATLPVLIAGDTNLPEPTWALARYLGDYQDGFVKAGRGFGYTFPAVKRPWMRIDRILADSHFRFVSFSVVKPRVSDHFAVTADLELSTDRL
jgi:vancomycin resistance protein VanJ